MSDAAHDWLPFDEGFSQTQIAAVLDLASPAPLRVLDLGCGDGRTLVPLVAAGHAVTGLDRDAAALRRCRETLDAAGPLRGSAVLVEMDFADPWPPGPPFDLVCCLGNTIMTVVEPDAAIDLLGRVAGVLASGGRLVIDDCPGEHWPELTEGNWQSGLSEDGSMQMLWAEDDAVFTVRRGRDVDPDNWTIGAGDVRYRLWTMATLTLAARLAGLSVAARRAGGGVLVICPPAGVGDGEREPLA